jgi:hypothetical protein
MKAEKKIHSFINTIRKNESLNLQIVQIPREVVIRTPRFPREVVIRNFLERN